MATTMLTSGSGVDVLIIPDIKGGGGADVEEIKRKVDAVGDLDSLASGSSLSQVRERVNDIIEAMKSSAAPLIAAAAITALSVLPAQGQMLLEDIPGDLPVFSEYAAREYFYATYDVDSSGISAENFPYLDAMRLVANSGGMKGVTLHAWREARDADGGVFTEELADADWTIRAGSEYAMLLGNVLTPTTNFGTVVVGYVSETYPQATGTVTVSVTPIGTDEVLSWPSREDGDSQRYGQGMITEQAYDNAATAPATGYYNPRNDTRCTIPDSLQLYTTADVANPSSVNSAFFSADIADSLRCQSVGRTDFGTGDATKPALFIAPHFALCAAHYTPKTATFCLDRETPVFKTYSFSVAATLGDLRLLRTDDEQGFPAELCAMLIAQDALEELSPSLYAAGLAFYQSQHGTVHPCLVWPLLPSGGWSVAPIGGRLNGGTNSTWDGLAGFNHAIHGGDSGHAVVVPNGVRVVAIGLLHTSTGSAQSLCSDAVRKFLTDNMAPYGETPPYLTVE